MVQAVTRKQMSLFFAAVALQSLAANFAHPITPTIIQDLGLPDYMFGLAFAGMSFTCFLFSPFWGKISTFLSSRAVLLISNLGYAAGQWLFAISTTVETILAARLIAGFFVGGVSVCVLTYVINCSPMGTRAKDLTIVATLTTVFAAFGYMVGGVLGAYSIPFTFALQVVLLCVSGACFYFWMKNDQLDERRPTKRELLREANPFISFLEVRNLLCKVFVILFVVVLLSSIASTAYDQCFNYFIKDQFHFSSAYNGLLRAIVGFISLAANATICMWIIRNRDVKHSLIWIFAIGAVTLGAMILVEDVILFIIINLIFFAINAIYIPLLQDVVAKSATHENSGVLMGFYNAIKSLGMIFGSLFAGFIYVYGAKLSFLYAGIFFAVSALLMVWYCRHFKTEK